MFIGKTPPIAPLPFRQSMVTPREITAGPARPGFGIFSAIMCGFIAFLILLALFG